MSFPVGITYSGFIKKIKGQGIITRFFSLGIPIIPLSGMFVMERLATGYKGFAMKLHAGSVLTVYFKVLSVLWALTLVVLFFVNQRDIVYLYAAAGALPLVVAAVIIGWVWKKSKARRVWLGTATGIYGYPWWLPKGVALDVYVNLQTAWEEGGYGYNWEQALADTIAHKDHLHLVYSLGVYAAYCEPGMKDYAEQARRLLEKYYFDYEDFIT